MIEPQMKNPYTYCFTTEVPYYQCDLSGKMKLSWLLKVMERAAGEHLEHLGLPYDRLYQEGIVFLLSKAGVRIHRCPGWFFRMETHCSLSFFLYGSSLP